MDIEDKTHKAIILLKDIAEWYMFVCVVGGSREGVRKGAGRE